MSKLDTKQARRLATRFRKPPGNRGRRPYPTLARRPASVSNLFLRHNIDSKVLKLFLQDTIGAHSKLVAYRRFFECAGVMVEEDIIITRPAALPDSELVKEVPVELMLEPQVFIKAIKVILILADLF